MIKDPKIRFLEAAVKAQAARIRDLEHQIISLQATIHSQESIIDQEGKNDGN